MEKNSQFVQAEYGIIIAADVPTINELKNLADIASQVSDAVAIKIGFSLALRYGLPSLVKAVNEVSSLPVIYDHQKAATDIPAMGEPFAEVCHEAGIHGVIFFPQAGPKTLEAFVNGALKWDLTPIVGLVMTHPAYLQSEGGFICDDAPNSICQMAVGLGVRGFVLPGTKITIVKRFAEGPLAEVKPVALMMPGIGSQGGSIARAVKAAKGHHPFPIIGSAIYSAPNPKAALEAFAAEMKR